MTRIVAFELWIALGCPQQTFDPWYDQPQMTPADAWAQILAAIRGNTRALLQDTNPPAPTELIEAADRIPGTARWLVSIAADIRAAGDIPLVRLDENGVAPADISLADELWLAAVKLHPDTAFATKDPQ